MIEHARLILEDPASTRYELHRLTTMDLASLVAVSKGPEPEARQHVREALRVVEQSPEVLRAAGRLLLHDLEQTPWDEGQRWSLTLSLESVYSLRR